MKPSSYNLKNFELNNMNYFKFIESCKLKNYKGLKTQEHHIIPKCDNGSEKLENKIYLSVHDHFWAHIYYTETTGKCPTGAQFILINYNAKKEFTPIEWDYCYKIAIDKIKGVKKSEQHKQNMSKSAYNVWNTIRQRKPELTDEEIKLKNLKKEKNIQIRLNNLHKSHIGREWYNNGINEIFQKECPAGYKKGRLSFKYCTNGIIDKKYKDVCPEGFWPGRTRTSTNEEINKISESLKGSLCYTNGIKNIRSKTGCPEGFWPGRVRVN